MRVKRRQLLHLQWSWFTQEKALLSCFCLVFLLLLLIVTYSLGQLVFTVYRMVCRVQFGPGGDGEPLLVICMGLQILSFASVLALTSSVLKQPVIKTVSVMRHLQTSDSLFLK